MKTLDWKPVRLTVNELHTLSHRKFNLSDIVQTFRIERGLLEIIETRAQADTK
jgi:hypothetical protein